MSQLNVNSTVSGKEMEEQRANNERMKSEKERADSEASEQANNRPSGEKRNRKMERQIAGEREIDSM